MPHPRHDDLQRWIDLTVRDFLSPTVTYHYSCDLPAFVGVTIEKEWDRIHRNWKLHVLSFHMRPLAVLRIDLELDNVSFI